MIVDGVQHNLKGTVMLIPGDNLASQCLGGYKSLASALRKCRQCMAVNTDMQTKVSKYMRRCVNKFVSPMCVCVRVCVCVHVNVCVSMCECLCYMYVRV